MTNVDRWALIVGISRYASQQLTLNYAANDASTLCSTLLEPTAGAFPKDHVLALVDESATLGNLTKALRTFLKRPAENDLVVVFFACHGARDGERPDNLYLLPYDTEPGDISGTGLPMREVDLALRETLHSRRVVVLMDACHSGGLGDAFSGLRSASDDAADLNTYLGRLSEARGGLSLMTSAMANESSVEGPQWGEGHGVFTHFVLEGLRGKADRLPYDGIVTVGELFDFVQQRVQEETGGKQHPHISAAADRDLVLSVTGSLSATQNIELAERLDAAADLLGEPACWRGAAMQYGEAMRLRGSVARAEYGVPHALALFRSGDAGAAEQALRELPRDLTNVRSALGMIELALGHLDDARATLLQPEPVSKWVPALFAPSLLRGRRVALLVGLDAVDPAAFGGWSGQLKSCVAETLELAKVLETLFSFDEVIYLLDGQATMEAIRASLGDLMQRSAACESVVFAFSGHGGQLASKEPPRGRDSTLVAFDGQLTSDEIDGLLRQSAAGRTTLIVSAAHGGRFVELARASGYEAMAGCAENETDMDGEHLGAFMEAMLPHLKADTSGAALANMTRRDLKRINTYQHPEFTIDAKQTVLVGRLATSGPSGATAVLAQVMLGWSAAESTQIMDEISALAVRGDIAPSAIPILALEWHRRNEFARVATLPVALDAASTALAYAALAAAARQPRSLTLAAVLQHVAASPAVIADPTLAADVQSLETLAEGSNGTPSRIHAILVGISSPSRSIAKSPKGAASNVDAVRTALLTYGVPAAQITVLIDATATHVGISTALEGAARAAERQAVLIYWCGPGSLDGFQCIDEPELTLVEIAHLAGTECTLVADGITTGSPVVSAAADNVPRLILIEPAVRVNYAGRRTKRPQGAKPRRAARSVLADLLIRTLQLHTDLCSVRASQLTTRQGPPMVQSASGDDRLLSDPVVNRVDRLIARLRDAELAATASLLARSLERRGGIGAEAQLQLGILLAELGRFDTAVDAFEHAIQQFGADTRGEALARLQLGRTLLRSGRDRARAVSECRLATQRDPTLDGAWFWLGRAIFELIQRETQAQAKEALRTYLARGAPLGRRAEVAALLGAMPH